MTDEKLNELVFNIHWKVEQWFDEIEKKKVAKQLQQETNHIVDDYYNTKNDFAQV